ncbi:hypothetical protein APHAL10511_005572 [Amanita phalloides]|nr:hypothetical protein APHAL10511_005572 [Amanita phalloides]
MLRAGTVIIIAGHVITAANDRIAMRLLVLVVLAALAAAYSGTHPVLAWSSQPSNVLQSLPQSFEKPHSPLAHIVSNNAVCDHSAVIIIEHPGVHASVLRSLSPSSGFVRSFSNPSLRYYPYMPIDLYDVSVHVDKLSQQCGSRIVKFSPGQGVTFDLGYRYVIHMNLPGLHSLHEPQKNVMKHHDDILSRELDSLTSIFPEHLIIYMGVPLLPEFTKRQAPEVPERPVLQLSDSYAPSNATLPTGGILKHYQLLTPALISSLLLVLFILLPIVMFGITALASIQSPLKVENPKGYSAREKKIQ